MNLASYPVLAASLLNVGVGGSVSDEVSALVRSTLTGGEAARAAAPHQLVQLPAGEQADHEAAIRRAAAQQLNRILDHALDPPSAVEAVRDLVGDITLQLGLVELRDQILTGSATAEAVTKKENGLRSWIRAKLRGLNLGKYGTVTSTDCHRAAHSLWRDAQRLIAAT